MLRIILLNYNRPDNVKNIVFSLRKYFPRITIINNNPTYQLPYWGGQDDRNIDVINNEKNYFCMERWIRSYEYPEEYKLILDDDILPSPTLIKKMVESNLSFTGIYGKRGVATANTYNELEDVWKPEEVDFIVGACILIKQSLLNEIEFDLKKIGYPERGDDIIVSYLIKHKLQIPLKLVSGKFMFLPEGNVGLNKNKEHFLMRWNMVQKFKNIGWTD